MIIILLFLQCCNFSTFGPLCHLARAIVNLDDSTSMGGIYHLQLFLLLIALFFIVFKKCSRILVMGIQKSAAKITFLRYRRRVRAPAHQYLHRKM